MPRSDVHFREESHNMKRSLVSFCFFVFSVVLGARTLQVPYPERAPTPDREAASADQLAVEGGAPKLQIPEEVLPRVVPGRAIGETEWLPMNSNGSLFVYS